jgi:hypothetical protein
MRLRKTGAFFIVAALTLANAVTIAATAPAPAPPTSSIALQPYACRAFDETGRNRIAFKADGSRFVAPMGRGKIGVFTVHSEPKPLNDKDIKRYKELVTLLEDENFGNRLRATEALRAMGTPIRPLLQESLRKAGSLESRIRLRELLVKASLDIHTVHFEKVISSLIRSVRYSPNGEQLLVAGYGDAIKLLNASDHKVVRSIPAKGNVTDALFLNNGDRLAASIGDKVQFWSTRTGEPLPDSLTHMGKICCMDASPDERWLAASGGGTNVSIWDLKTRRRVHLLEGFGASVGHVEFSPDGKYLACACGDRNVSVWDVPTFRQRHTLKGHKGSVYHVTFSRDGQWLASTGNVGDVIIWDPVKGERLATNDDRKEYCTPTFSPDGKFLVTLETDRIRLWRITRAMGAK